uniref:Uracil-DNA glycosylase n=1 Tax=Marseillevirus LCMAC101 TaxID=2506602 RepID=A0A481YRS7_9VIRU|nr:MAG: uracil-DNA glycosylase [Marseillevirus LCMAC101]
MTDNFVTYLYQTDLLELSSKEAQIIAQQCNCYSKKGAGLSKDIAKKFPYANFYSSREDESCPGTIEVRGDRKEKERFVMALYAQKRPGKPKGSDSAEKREEWFSECLDRIPKKYKKLKSIAFPHGIGCGLANGNWENYEKIICDWAMEYPHIKVMIASRDDPPVTEKKKEIFRVPQATKDIMNDPRFLAMVWQEIVECPFISQDYFLMKAAAKIQLIDDYCSINLKDRTIKFRPGWKKFFDDQKDNLLEVFNFIDREQNKGKVIYPPKEDIFAAFRFCDLKDIKVVVIGQDPYHTEGAAMGLAFSHLPDKDGRNRDIQPSLGNIFKELKNDGFTPNDTGDLTPWARQGVFLINTALTVEEGKAKSHKKAWDESCFIDQLFRYLNRKCEHLVIIAWGKDAQELAKIFTDPHQKIVSSHPSPFSANQGFFGSSPFSKTNKFLKKWGKEPIDWNLD